jgi:beta-glucosidase-like glycosyl hydrolase
MSAYNSVNGEWAGQNGQPLIGILRDQWGFDGFVMTDFVFGLRDAVESVRAGQDLEMPFHRQRARALPAALRDGRLTRSDIERAAHRILAAQIRWAARTRPAPPASIVANPAHRALAHEAAVRSTVLLRNQAAAGRPVLPIALGPDTRVAVLGALATSLNQGDIGSSAVRPPSWPTSSSETPSPAAVCRLRFRPGARTCPPSTGTPARLNIRRCGDSTTSTTLESPRLIRSASDLATHRCRSSRSLSPTTMVSASASP